MGAFKRIILLALAVSFGFAPCGCGSGSPALDVRRKELAYTKEQLASELIQRLERASATAARNSSRAQGPGQAPDVDSERGNGFEGRPDPNSIEAIVEDARVKIQGMTELGETNVEEEVVGIISSAKSIPEDIRSSFASQLADSMPVQ